MLDSKIFIKNFMGCSFYHKDKKGKRTLKH